MIAGRINPASTIHRNDADLGPRSEAQRRLGVPPHTRRGVEEGKSFSLAHRCAPETAGRGRSPRFKGMDWTTAAFQHAGNDPPRKVIIETAQAGERARRREAEL